MTPKEKAIELWNKFLIYAETEIPPESDNNVRNCCLICVDEIMKEVLPIGARSGNERHLEIYWQSVKEELEKI